MNKGERPGRSAWLKQPKANVPDTQSLAVAALRFFADDPAQAGRFFAWSGLDGDTIRKAASEPGFAASVLEYLMQDEPSLLRFADHAKLNPADVAAVCEAGLARGRGLDSGS